MPFVRGRYHMNQVLGEALEAAREAENALLELQQEQEGSADSSRQKAPIDRVEIEAAELVPAHLGRGGRGYVARVRRQAPGVQASASDDFEREAQESASSNPRAAASRSEGPLQGETHVFANHGDLVNFLQNELGNKASQE